jgi:hypothetical protein
VAYEGLAVGRPGLQNWYRVSKSRSRWWLRRGQRRARSSDLLGSAGSRIGVGSVGVMSGEQARLQAVELFAQARGVGELWLREPGFDRPGPQALTDREVEQRLAGLTGYLPHGLYDGVRLSLPAAWEILRGMLRRNGLWCELVAEGRLAVCVDDDGSVLIGSDLPCDDAVASVGRLGLTIVATQDPLGSVIRYPLRAAGEAYWADVAAAAGACGTAIAFMDSYASNVERWRLVDAAGLEAVRAELRPRSLVKAYAQPLVPATEPNRSRLAARAEEIMEFFCVGKQRYALNDVVCLTLNAETGRLHGYWITSEEDLAEWIASTADASAIGVYPYTQPHESTDNILTAALPDADGVVRARWG